MINTHILSREFEYLEPKTIDEAVQLLAAHGEKGKLMAGGTDLLVEMKMDRLRPERVINISKIPGLRYLNEGKGLRIGSLTPFREIENSRTIESRYAALHEAARSISSVQIKNMGTLGGNLCHGSPAADSAPPLIALGAKVRLLAAGGERAVSLEEFFLGPGQTVLSPRELLVEIEVAEPTTNTGSSFLKMTRVAADLAKVSVAVVIRREGEVCSDCRVVLGAVAKVPMRAIRTEELLRGKRLNEEVATQAGHRASEEIQPITDIRSTAGYRRELSKVMVRDAILMAWKRAAGLGMAHGA